MREHLDEGALQAYLDGELTSGARESASRHLETCAGCREELDALRRLGRSVRAALEPIDPPHRDPTAVLWDIRRRRAAMRARTRRRRTAAAASLVLLFGAGLAAAAPGSPIRDWWESRGAPSDAVPAITAEERAAPEEASEVSVLPVDGDVLVSFDSVRPGSPLEVVVSDVERATVSAPSGARFETGAGRVRVDAQEAAAGTFRVELPALARSEVRVGERTYVTVDDGEVGRPGPEPSRSADGVLHFEVVGPEPSPGAEGTTTVDDG